MNIQRIFKANSMVSSIPVIHNGIIYFGAWDCNFYALSLADRKPIWKFHTALSYPSPIDIESQVSSTSIQAVWTPDTEEGKAKALEESGISDYGEFSGAYIDTSKTDYLGSTAKGYVKKKSL